MADRKRSGDGAKGAPGRPGSRTALGGFVPMSTLQPTIASTPDPSDGPPCHLCSAHCCRYFALEIDRPSTPEDHDQIRWYLLHQGAVVWVQDGDWYLEVRSACRHLLPDNSCGIYETRPQVCRDYGLPSSDSSPCEFFGSDSDFDLHFETPEAFEAWSRRELAERERRLARRRDARRRRKLEAEKAPLSGAARAGGG